MVQLYDVITNNKKLRKQGFILDSDLSNHNQQAYYNPEKKKLIYNVSGSHNLKDWGTNFYLGIGKLKHTKRYQQAHQGLRDAKLKYGVESAVVSGSSLGGAVASSIGQKQDKIYTFNKGATIGQKVRDNEVGVRIAGDPVSILSSVDKNVKTLKNNNIKSGIAVLDGLNAHLSHNLKHSNIKV
jgi:hypothetical protein